MIALVQRVSEASVTINGQRIARIGPGLLALIGVEKLDTHKEAEQLADRIVTYRLFSDNQGRMNLDILSVKGSILLVPQFTLVADTHKGRRPGFSTAATPVHAELMFDSLITAVSARLEKVERGTFGADMQVGLINDGPVTFWLQVCADS